MSVPIKIKPITFCCPICEAAEGIESKEEQYCPNPDCQELVFPEILPNAMLLRDSVFFGAQGVNEHKSEGASIYVNGKYERGQILKDGNWYLRNLTYGVDFEWLEESDPEEYKVSALVEPVLQIVNVPISFEAHNNSLLSMSGRSDLKVETIIVTNEAGQRFELRLKPKA